MTEHHPSGLQQSTRSGRDLSLAECVRCGAEIRRVWPSTGAPLEVEPEPVGKVVCETHETMLVELEFGEMRAFREAAVVQLHRCTGDVFVDGPYAVTCPVGDCAAAPQEPCYSPLTREARSQVHGARAVAAQQLRERLEQQGGDDR